MRGLAQRSPDEARRFGRRAFIRTAALGAVAGSAGLLPGASASLPVSAAGTFVPTDPDLHLLRRATYGPTAASLRSIRRMGAGRWLEQQLDPAFMSSEQAKPGLPLLCERGARGAGPQQLDPASIGDTAVDDFITSRYPNLWLSVGKAYSTLGGSWDLMFDLGQAAIVRATWSNRQLLEVMVDFWSNHLT